jgi:uncharacterized protein YraI
MQHSNVKYFTLLITLGLALILTACGGSETSAPTQDVAIIQTQAVQTAVAEMTLNAPAPTEAPEATDAPTEGVPPGPTPDPSIPVAVVPTPAPGDPAAIANFNTTIFSGPGTNYVVYASLLGGRSVQVTGKSEDGLWWAISVPVAPNGTGWVDAAWVTATNTDGVPVVPTPPVPPTVEMVPPGEGDPQATALVNVHVRSGPASSFPAYGIAPAGVTGRVLGVSEDGQWWVVRLDPTKVGTGYGWVMTQYTTATNVTGIQVIKTPESTVAEAPPPPATGAPTATAVENVNIRSGPGTNYPVLFVAPAGASGEVSGKSADGGWWQVKIATTYAADGLGWVSAGYVTTQNVENVPVVDAPPAPPVLEPTPPPSTSSGCTLVSQSPADGTIYNQGVAFDTTWVIQNTGTTKWDGAEYDLSFVGAVDNIYLHTGPDRDDLNTNVDPGATYNFTVPMLAPFSAGQFGEMWQLTLGNQAVCQFYVYITVP